MLRLIAITLTLILLCQLSDVMALSRLGPKHLAHKYFQVEHTQGSACQRMASGGKNYCGGYGYNTTIMPNLLFQNQDDATEQLRGFDPLILSNCSQELSFLLCSIYFPICSAPGGAAASPAPRFGKVVSRPQEDIQMTTPCRSMCERVKERCFPVLDRFGFGWPADLECSGFQSETVAVGPQNEIVVCFDRPPNNFHPNVEAAGTCRGKRLCKSVPVKKKTFKKSRFHFSIVGKHIKSGMTADFKSLYVNISKVLFKCKQEVIPRPVARQLRAGSTALLMTQGVDVCDCPTVGDGPHIFSGWVQREKLYLQKVASVPALAKSTSPKLEKKVKKWTKKYCSKI